MDSDWDGSRTSQTVPEILPPESRPEGHFDPRSPQGRDYSGGVPVRTSTGTRWASAPATYTLVGVNCAVYLAMAIRGVSPTAPTVGDLVHWGANFGGYVLAGQWWRLLTAAFVHVGILHL